MAATDKSKRVVLFRLPGLFFYYFETYGNQRRSLLISLVTCQPPAEGVVKDSKCLVNVNFSKGEKQNSVCLIIIDFPKTLFKHVCRQYGILFLCQIKKKTTTTNLISISLLISLPFITCPLLPKKWGMMGKIELIQNFICMFNSDALFQCYVPASNLLYNIRY